MEMVHDRSFTVSFNNSIQIRRPRYEPWDIAVIPKTYSVVTSSTFDDHVLQFLDIKKRSYFKETKLKDSEQSGIPSGVSLNILCEKSPGMYTLSSGSVVGLPGEKRSFELYVNT
jgi:hypothetical protein